MALAKRTTLRASDLSPAWTRQQPTKPSNELPTCPGVDMDFSAFTITGTARSSFELRGASVDSQVEVFKSRSDAAGDFRKGTSAPALRCLGRWLRDESAKAQPGVRNCLVPAAVTPAGRRPGCALPGRDGRSDGRRPGTRLRRPDRLSARTHGGHAGFLERGCAAPRSARSGPQGRRPVALAPQPLELAGERPAADHALGARRGTLAEPSIRGDEPVRSLELRCFACDPVVGGLLPLEDDDRTDVFPLAPGVDELDELLARNVRPQRATDVLGVDEDGRDRLRQRAALRFRGSRPIAQGLRPRVAGPARGSAPFDGRSRRATSDCRRR